LSLLWGLLAPAPLNTGELSRLILQTKRERLEERGKNTESVKAETYRESNIGDDSEREKQR